MPRLSVGATASMAVAGSSSRRTATVCAAEIRRANLARVRSYATGSDGGHGGDGGDDGSDRGNGQYDETDALLAGLPVRPTKPLTRAKLRRARNLQDRAAKRRGEYVEPRSARYRSGWTDPKPEFRQCLRLAHALAKRWQDPYIFWSARALCRRQLSKAYERPDENASLDHRVFMKEKSPTLIKQRNAYRNLRQRMKEYRKAWAGRRRDSQKILEETYGRKGVLRHRLFAWMLERRVYPNPDYTPSAALLFCLKSPTISPTPLPDRFLPHDVPFPKVHVQGEGIHTTRKRDSFFRIMYDRMRFPLAESVVAHIEDKSRALEPWEAGAGAGAGAGASSSTPASEPTSAAEADLAEEDKFEEEDWLREIYEPTGDEELGGEYMKDAFFDVNRANVESGGGTAPFAKPRHPVRQYAPFTEPRPKRQPSRSRTGIPVPMQPTTAPADAPIIPGPLHPNAPHYLRACRRLWSRILSITPIIGTGHPGTSLERAKARVGEAFAPAAEAQGTPNAAAAAATPATAANAALSGTGSGSVRTYRKETDRGFQLEANYDVKVGRFHPLTVGLRSTFFDKPTPLSKSLIWSEYPPPHLLREREPTPAPECSKGEGEQPSAEQADARAHTPSSHSRAHARTGWWEGPLWASRTRLPTEGLRETYKQFAAERTREQAAKWAQEDAERRKRRGGGEEAPASSDSASASASASESESAPAPSPPLDIYFSPLSLFPQGTGPSGPSGVASPPPAGATLRPDVVHVPYLAGRTKVKIASSAYVSLEEALWARRGAAGQEASLIRRGKDGKRKERIA